MVIPTEYSQEKYNQQIQLLYMQRPAGKKMYQITHFLPSGLVNSFQLVDASARCNIKKSEVNQILVRKRD